MKTVLLTGAGGYLGKAIYKELTSNGYSVIAIEGSGDFKSQVNDAAKRNPEIVIHAGFKVDFSQRQRTENSNMINSVYLSECFQAKDVHFIFLSAAAVLGVSRDERARTEEDFGTCDEEFVSMRESNYVQDKMAVEEILKRQQKKLTILYLTTVYGSGMPAETLKALSGGRWMPFRIAPPGGTSYLMLGDFLDFLHRTTSDSLSGSFLLNSANIRYKDLFRRASAAQGKWQIIFTIPVFFFRFITLLPMRGGFLASMAVILSSFGFKYYSPEKALRMTGWRPRGDLDQFFSGIFR